MSLTKVSNQITQTPYKRNIIINGACNVWQRAAASTLTAGNSGFSADRFKMANASDGQVYITVGVNGTAHNSMRNYAYAATTATDTSMSATQAVGYQYVLEGYDIRPIIGQVCTLSFWVYSSIGGVYCVSFSNMASSTTDRSYVTEISLPAGQWVYRTITFTMHDLSSGSYWNTLNDAGLRIWWTLDSGSNYITSTKDSWVNGNYVATSNQTHHMATLNAAFGLSGVQLELGASATPFEYKSFSEELAACQRYYEKSYDYSVVPGSTGGYGSCQWLSNYSATGVYFDNLAYNTKKRCGGNIVVYSPGTGASGKIRNASAGVDITANAHWSGERGYCGPISTVENVVVGNSYNWHWTINVDF
jgi:hypothetical protein